MYKQISDYGLIGDMHSVAMVSSDGSIDFSAMPHIDSPTVFASILDDEKGGFFAIHPTDKFTAKQTYMRDTNILKCEFESADSQAELVDFMPKTEDELFDKADHVIRRCLKVTKGEMTFNLICDPRPGYGNRIKQVEQKDNNFIFSSEGENFTLKTNLFDYAREEISDGVSLSFSLKENQMLRFDFIYGMDDSKDMQNCSMEETRLFWINWLHNCVAGKCVFLGEYTEYINRSLLALKLLTFAPTGAIAAAATTSLPEWIGSERNWDYRFTWIRDASFTLKALFNLGHLSEAESFIHWLHDIYGKYGSKNLQIMYSLKGEANLKETIIENFKGYKNSYPVRAGNGAYYQRQWDIYGEIMDTALRLSDYAGKIDEELWPFFKDICNLAIKNWRNPDDGIWEVRNGPFHFVYSKVMCWVALDRGLKIARRYGFSAPFEIWEKEKEAIKEEVLRKGFNKKMNSFVQRYESEDLDSSLLLIALMNFLPITDDRIQGTIAACVKELLKNGFLLRYQADDGLDGEEGGFLLCNYWLVECLALSGNIKKAKEVLRNTLKAANHLGLFSEEFDYKNNEMLGNFPQAFSHIGFINAVTAILDVEFNLQKPKTQTNWLAYISKRLVGKIILNKTKGNLSPPENDIAGKLKSILNNLQGAFFDVNQGRVNYDKMKVSISYGEYQIEVRKLKTFDLGTLIDEDKKKAFWINIYNIMIIHGVIELGINSSVKEVFNFFSRIGYVIGDLFFTPDDIEHGILRANQPHPGTMLRAFAALDKRKEFALKNLDPRIHFALVCAASSCPPVEFYDAKKLDKQLDVAGRSFLNRRGIVLNKGENIVALSQIFKWYARDFGLDNRQVLDFAANFTTATIRDYLLENKDKVSIKYLPYDWNLNRTLE